MAGYKRLFLDTDNYYDLVTSYINVNGIWLNPLEYMAVHDGTTLGLQHLFLQGTEFQEVAFADLDLALSVGMYTVDPTTNSVILIVNKATIDTEAKAIAYIQGLLINYQMEALEYYSTTDALYTMETMTSSGVLLGSTQASSTSVLVSKMLVFDAAQNMNSETGYYEHKFRRALQASA